MNHLVVTASAFAALAAVWSLPPVREYVADCLPTPFDEFADRWGGALLCVPVLVLFFWIIPATASAGDSVSSRPARVAKTNERVATPNERSGSFLTGSVVAPDSNKKLSPVRIGEVRIGQHSCPLTDSGTFRVSLPDSPQPDTLVEIGGEHCLNRFLRLDDPILAQKRPIELAARRRILVVQIKPNGTANGAEEIRRSMENELANGQLDLLSDDTLRDAVVDRLYKYQQNDALYDPKTLARVGNFEGATDVVFWSLTSGSNSYSIECRLVNLMTARTEYTVNQTFAQGTPMAAAAESAADTLLSRMATAIILSPKDLTEVRRNISARGYAVYIPPSWTLWIGALPEGNDRIFPQRRLASHGDQTFYAPDVYAGPAGILRQPMRLELYTVLAAPEYSQTIEAYINSGAQAGLAMNAWDKERFKILDHVTVVRSK